MFSSFSKYFIREEQKAEEITAEEKMEEANKNKKQIRGRKSKESAVEQAALSESMELAEEQGATEILQDLPSKKDEETQEEQEQEQRKREEFKAEERELSEEIERHAGVCSEVPLGLDRIYSRYWSLRYVDGLIVEQDEEGRRLAEVVSDEDDEFDAEFQDDSQLKVSFFLNLCQTVSIIH